MAFELAELAEELQRQRLRRRLPAATEEHIERLLEEWYLTRPGAEHGDLRRLLDEAATDDLDVARAAARIIVERGYERGRDLPALLDALLASRARTGS